MTSIPLAPQRSARLVMTMPPSPRRIERVLAASPASSLLEFTVAEDAVRHLAREAQGRLVVMTSYLDATGCAGRKPPGYRIVRANDMASVAAGEADASAHKEVAVDVQA